MNKESFLAEYERELVARYPWAADSEKLARFMAGVRATLAGASTWDPRGEAVTAAWRSIGGKGKPTLKALRALPAVSQSEPS